MGSITKWFQRLVRGSETPGFDTTLCVREVKAIRFGTKEAKMGDLPLFSEHRNVDLLSLPSSRRQCIAIFQFFVPRYKHKHIAGTSDSNQHIPNVHIPLLIEGRELGVPVLSEFRFRFPNPFNLHYPPRQIVIPHDTHLVSSSRGEAEGNGLFTLGDD